MMRWKPGDIVTVREETKNMLRYRGIDNGFIDSISGAGTVQGVEQSPEHDENGTPIWTSVLVVFASGKSLVVHPDWIQHAQDEGN